MVLQRHLLAISIAVGDIYCRSFRDNNWCFLCTIWRKVEHYMRGDFQTLCNYGVPFVPETMMMMMSRPVVCLCTCLHWFFVSGSPTNNQLFLTCQNINKKQDLKKKKSQLVQHKPSLWTGSHCKPSQVPAGHKHWEVLHYRPKISTELFFC